MIQDYPYLPGMKTIFEDGVVKTNKDLNEQTSLNAQSVLFVGTAIDGPKDIPVQVTPENAEKIFGPFVNSQGELNGTTLTQSFEAAYDAGVRNIMLMRVTGTESSISLEAPVVTKTDDEIKEQYVGRAKGYEIDLLVDHVKRNSLVVKAINIVSGAERTISNEKYVLMPKGAIGGNDLLILTGTAFSNKEKIAVSFLFSNKLGDAVIPANPKVETDLEFVENGEGYKVSVSERIFELEDIKTTTEDTVSLNDIVIIENEVFFPTVKSVPKVKEVASADISSTLIAGKVVAEVPTVKGKPIGDVKIYHDAAYPATAGVVIGTLPVLFDEVSTKFYIDLTEIAVRENLMDAADAAGLEETSVEIKFSAIPKVKVSFFTTNGDKESELEFNFTTAERNEEFDLEQSPKSVERVFVYIDGSELLNRDAIKLTSGNKLSVDKYFLPKDSDVEVRYTYERKYTHTPTIELVTAYAGGIYNETSISITNITSTTGAIIGKTISIAKPESKRANYMEKATEFSSLDYPTFGELVKGINDMLGYFVKVSANDEETLTIALDSFDTKYFVGGDDGVNVSKEEYYTTLSGIRDSEGYLIKPGIFQILENVKTDWIVPLGVCVDDELPGRFQNFAYELAMFCAYNSQNSRITLGMIPAKPLKNYSLAGLQSHASYLAAMDNEFFVRDARGNMWKNEKGQPHDIGKWITVVGEPEPIVKSQQIGTYKANRAVIAVALSAVLPIKSSGSQKALPDNVVGLSYNFSNTQSNKIVGNRVAIFGLDEDGLPILVDGCNSARAGSRYGRLSVTKSLRRAVDLIKQVGKPFLGESISVEDQNSLTSDISKALGGLVSEGEIRTFEFQIVFGKTAQTFKEAQIELTIGVFDELRRITTVVNLV